MRVTPALALTAALVGSGVAAAPAARAAQVVVGVGLPYLAPPVAVLPVPFWGRYWGPYFRPAYGYHYGHYGRYYGPWHGRYPAWRR
jgi:hypothetical protein